MPVTVTIYNDDDAKSREIEAVIVPADHRSEIRRTRLLPGDPPVCQQFELERDDMLIIRRVG